MFAVFAPLSYDPLSQSVNLSRITMRPEYTTVCDVASCICSFQVFTLSVAGCNPKMVVKICFYRPTLGKIQE